MAEKKLVDAYVQLSARGFTGVQQTLKGVETAAKSSWGVLSNIAQITAGNVLAGGIMRLTSAVSSIPGQMLQANADYETALVGFEVLLGSMDKAKDRVAQLTKFAADTPFELPGILKTSKQLEMAKAPAEKHMQLLKMTGDMASAANVDISELGMWVSRSYSAIQAGRPWGEAAMRMQELGVLSGDARDKMERMQETGASSTEIWAEFEKEMGRFNGMMEKQSQTWSGLASTLKDNVLQGLRVMGEPVFNAVKGALSGVVGLVNGPDFMESASRVGEQIVEGFIGLSNFMAPVMVDLQTLLGSLYELVGGASAVDTVSEAFGGLMSFVAACQEFTYAFLSMTVEMTGVVLAAINDLIVSGLAMLGVEVQSTGSIWSAAWSGMVNWISFAAEMMRNWDLVFEMVAVYLMNFGDNAVEVFVTVGSWLSTFFTNIVTIASSLGQAYLSIWLNVAHNIGEAFKHAWGYISGQDIEINYVDIMDGVSTALAQIPEFAGMNLQSVEQRYGADLDAIGEKWGEREAERQKKIDDFRKQNEAKIRDTTGVGKPKPDTNSMDDEEAANNLAQKNKGGATDDKYAKKKKKEDIGGLTDVASFWEKIQKGAMKDKTAAEKKAEEQRNEGLVAAKEQNATLKDIKKNTAVPPTATFA